MRRASLLAFAATVVLAVASGSLALAGSAGAAESPSFRATFAAGQVAPFAGAQCANTGTPSTPPRLRGTLTIAPWTAFGIAPPVFGTDVAQITDPAVSMGALGYTLVNCGLLTPRHALPLGQTIYYGLAVYVPQGWSLPNSSFFGDNIEEFQFQNIAAAPVIWQLHGAESAVGPHVTLALETGACAQPAVAGIAAGCAYRSNADDPSRCPASSTVTCLAPQYAIPPGAFVEGQWNEILMSVTWAASGGQISTWYKVSGARTWNAGSSVSGIPTVQWPDTHSGPGGSALDTVESYTGSVGQPFSIYVDDVLESTRLGDIAGGMPPVIAP